MRIALIYLGRRGAGLPISLELARSLGSGDQVLAVLSGTAAAAGDWQALGVEILACETYQHILQAGWSWVERSRIRTLARQIAAWKPDVLLFPMFYTWNPFLQAELIQIPSVVAVHDPRPHPGLSDRLFQWLEDRSIQQAERCLVFSQVLAPELVRRGCQAQNIDVIRLGMFNYASLVTKPGEARKPGRRQPATLLFFGRITAYKGLDILLKAFQQVRQLHPVHLLVAGEGSLRPYRALIRAIGDIEVINRWIDDSEIAGIFSQADMVILPYTSASQSGVLPIAASFGLPVIATNTGGIPEQLTDGQSGLLVEPGSVEQLSAAIQRLLVDQELSDRLAETLQADFRTRYSWQDTAVKIRASLKKACNLRND